MDTSLRLLMLEDNPLDAELVLLELRRAGFDPEWQRVEAEAEYLDRLEPELDIILSDYEMPTFSGPRALELLKESGMDIPFIIISGTIGEDVAVDVMKQGATDYLLKDRLVRLGIAVRQAIEQGRLRRERTKAKDELRWKTAFLEAQVNSTLDGLLVVDAHGRKILQNQRMADLFKMPKQIAEALDDKEQLEWVTGMTVNPSSFIERVLHLYTHPDEVSRDEIELKNGTVLDRYSSPVIGKDGKYYGRIWTFRDITESKHAGDRLLEQASLLDKARDAILVRDLEHGITYWNKSAELLYGWTAAEVMGRKASELLYRDRRALEPAIATILRDGEWRGQIEQINKAGEPILVEARWTLVRDDAGRPKSILAINTDITEKKKLEQQFFRIQRMESIGTLAGGIAHDLNNVLAPILMSIELLRLTNRDERTQSTLSTIESSARRGADMVKQILSFARGVEGQRVMINPRLIIEEIQHLVKDTFPKNILFRADLTAKPPNFLGDHTQVHQILLNLCVNARDAMPEGGTLTVSASSITLDENYAALHASAKSGDYVMIKVADTGSGIPPQVMEKIFDPFFTTKELGKGTGLGLSTVLTIVKSHDGFLNVYSEVGNGTTFTVFFPACISASVDSGQPEEMHPRGRGELILVVDDDAAVRTITQQTLEAFGYRALVAADGTEAITLYSQHQADVSAVLTDMMMPFMDGPATIQMLKSMNPALKIIAASGLTNEGGAARAAGMGVQHFLPKPYTAQTVLTTLRKTLDAGI